MTTSTSDTTIYPADNPDNDTGRGYSAVARLLHWLVAGGIVLQFVLGAKFPSHLHVFPVVWSHEPWPLQAQGLLQSGPQYPSLHVLQFVA